jgi:Leucine-rich repeat (LRR) protein
MDDREVALWTLAEGGRVRITGGSSYLSDPAELPATFTLDALDWLGVNGDPPDLARLANLRHLRELHLPGPFWSRNADGGKDGSNELRHLAGISTLETLTFSYHFLDNIRFRDQGLSTIYKLTGLKELVLRQTQITGATLKPFTALERLDVSLTRFDDRGAEHLAGMRNLKRLKLGDTLFTDAAAGYLENLTELEELDLHGNAIGDATVSRLGKLAKLRVLNLMGTGVTDASLDHIARLPALEELNLYRTKVSNTGLSRLSALKSLREADLRYSRITRSGVDQLRASLPRVRVLFVDSAGRTAKVPQEPGKDYAAWIRALGGRLRGDELDLHGAPFTDAMARHLKPVRKLNLEATDVGDGALEFLSRMAGLEELNLNSTQISDAAPLTKLPRLRVLDAGNTYLESVPAFPALHTLILDGAPVTGVEAMPSLRVLSLAGTDLVEDSLAKLGPLESLNLSAADITNNGMPHLGKLTSLKRLILRDGRFTDEGVKALQPLAQLEELDLYRNRIGNPAAASLARLANLRRLTLDYAELGNEGVSTLSALAKLEYLSLDSTLINDGAVAALSSMKSLKELNLYHTLVTPEGFAALKAALPGCRIIWDKDSSLPNRRRS